MEKEKYKKSISENIEIKDEVKGSIFIGNIFNVQTEEEAKQKIKEISNKYNDATHNCYAYIVGNIERFSDDGEPAKTAGYPILSMIKGYDLTDILIIVTRYFGGTLLGTGGLIRAYGNCSKHVINESKIVEYIYAEEIQFSIEYAQVDKIKYFLEKNNCRIIEEQYLEKIYFKIYVPFNKKDEVVNYLIGKNFNNIGNGRYIERKENE